MRRLCCFLLALLCLLSTSALADEPSALRECTTEDQVLDWLLLPYEDEGVIYPVESQAGFVRYIAQNAEKDPFFCKEYWCSVEEGDNFDLNATVSRKGNTFKKHAGTMCTRATYAMALSYLGFSETPGDMSVMVNDRNIDDPYDAVTELLPGLERITYKSNVFKRMMANYLSDPSYSPVYVYIKKPGGAYHALLIVGKADQEDYYLVVDTATHYTKEAELVRVYRVRFNTAFRKILDSTYRSEHRGSQVVSFCQWRLTSSESE